MMHLLKLFFLMMLLTTTGLSHSQAQSTNNDAINEDASAPASTEQASKTLMPDSLLGTWIIDKEASIDYAKTTPQWNEKVAIIFPKLLEQSLTEVQQFSADSLVITQQKHQITFTANLLKATDNQLDVALTHDSHTSELYIQKMKNERINIQGQGFLGYEFFLWKKQ